MATPAAVLDILVAVNNGQAKTALAQTQGQLKATGKTASATGAVMKKAFLGMGLAAAGAAAALYKVGEEFDDAYDKIRTQTGATGKDLKKLEGSFKKVVTSVPTDFDSASTAIAGLNQRLNLTGKPLTKLTKQVVQLSEVTGTDVKENVESVTRLFGDWGVATKKQGKTLDGLFRISQETGTTVSDLSRNLVQFGAPLRNLGVDMDFAATMFANFEKSGVNMTTVLGGMRLAVGNLASPTDDLAKTMKQLGVSAKDPEKALSAFMDQITKAKTDSEAAGIAIELFGKRAGPDMADTIRGGKFHLDELMKTFNDGKGTIGDAERSTRDFGEQWQIFANNLKVAVEPVASKFFQGIGDLMKDVTKTFKKEGLSGVIDLLVDKLSDAIPKVTDVALDIGAKLGKGVIEGFLKSGPIVKFLAGAYFGTKFFNAAKTEAGGRAMGKSLGKGLLVGFVLAFPDLVKAAYEWGEKIGPKVRQIGSDIGEWFINGMIDVVNVGIAGINKAMDELNVLGKFGVDAPNIGDVGHVDFSGPIEDAEEARKQLKDKADAIRNNFHKGFDAVARDADTSSGKAFGFWRDSVGKLADRGGAWSGQFKDKVGGSFKGVAMDSDTYSAKAWSKWNQFGTHLNQEGTGKVDRWHGTLEDLFGDVARKSDKDSGDAWKYWRDFGTKLNGNDGSGKAATFRDAVAGSFRSLAKTSIGAIAKLAGETGKTLDSFDVKSQVYIAKWSGGESADTVKAQKGGVIHAARGRMVPGRGNGDKVPAMLEPGEVVLNKRAVAQMGGARKANRINRMIPRFATGGTVPGSTAGLHPGILGLVNSLYSKYGGSVSSGVRASDSGSLHSTGQAADYVPGNWAGASAAVNAIGPKLLEGIYNPGAYGGSPVSWDTGARVPSSFWGAEWGNHLDHIHLAIADGVSAAAGAVAKQIKRVMLSGPDGALKSMGQSALDKVRDAANSYLSKQGGLAGDTASTPGAPIKGLPKSLEKFNQVYGAHVSPDFGGYQMPVPSIVQLANWAGLPGDTFAKIAHGESNYRPGAVGVDPGGTRGYGLWQITTAYSDADVRAATGGVDYGQMLNPILNAKATKHKYDAAGGLSPWNGTQYLQSGGIVQKFAGGGKVQPIPGIFNTFAGHKPPKGSKPPSYTPAPPVYTPPPSIAMQIASLNIAAANAESTAGIADDRAVLDQRAILVKSQITKVSNLLAKKNLSPKRRLALMEKLATLKGDLNSIASSQQGLYDSPDFTGGDQTPTDTSAADQAAAQKALTDALQALTDEIAKQNALVNGAMASDYTQALAYIGDLLSGAVGGLVAPRLSTAGAGSVVRA